MCFARSLGKSLDLAKPLLLSETPLVSQVQAEQCFYSSESSLTRPMHMDP